MWLNIDETIKKDEEWDLRVKQMFTYGQNFRAEVEKYQKTIEDLLDIKFFRDDWEVSRELLKSYIYRTYKVKVTAFHEDTEASTIKHYFDLGQVRENEIYVYLDAIESDNKFCEVLVSGIASLYLPKVGYTWKNENKDFSVIDFAYVIEEAKDVLKYHFIEGFFGHKSNIPSLVSSLRFDKA